MHLIDLSNNIFFSDLLETDDTSVVKILTYLIAHIGDLNNLISTSYTISGNDASPELGLDEAAIFAAIYMMNYYQRQVQSNLGASAFDVLEVSEGDSRVRVMNRNELSKTYLQLKNQTKDNLTQMVESYRRWKCVPASIYSSWFCRITQAVE